MPESSLVSKFPEKCILSIYLQGAAALEAAQKVRIVVFDKTGTLTQGQPAVINHELFSTAHAELDIMRFAAAAEASSEHPIAQAILEYSHSQVRWPRQDKDPSAEGEPQVCLIK